MSGEKYVNVTERDYHHLMNSAKQVEQSKAQVEALDRQLQGQRAALQQQRLSEAQRQQAFDKTVNQLSSELQNSTRQMQRQQAIFASNVEDLSRQLKSQRAEYLTLFEQQAEHVQQQFAALAKTTADHQQLANRWLDDADLLLNHIQTQQQHERFFPGALAELRAQQHMAQTNVAQGVYQAAIASAQQLFIAAQKLSSDVEMAQREWDAFYQLLETEATALLAKMKTNQQSFQITFAGASEPLTVDLDYWSQGAYSAFLAELEQTLNVKHLQTLDTQALKQRLMQIDQDKAKEAASLEHAKEAVIASQLRFNMANELSSSLANAGWQIEDGIYEGCEIDSAHGHRNAYHMKLKNLAGDEMVTIITPVPNAGKIENQLTFAYYPHNQFDQRFHSVQTDKLNQIIQQELQLSQENLKCVPGQEHTLSASPVRKNFEQIKQQANPANHTPSRGH